MSLFWWVGSCWGNMFWLESEFFLLRLPILFLWVWSQMLLLPVLKCHSAAEAPPQNTKGKGVWLSWNDQGRRRRRELVAYFNTVNSTDLGFFNGHFLLRDCAQCKLIISSKHTIGTPTPEYDNQGKVTHWSVWLSWLECSPAYRRVFGLVPGQATCLGWRFDSSWCGRQLICVSHQDVPLPLSNRWKRIPRWGLKNKTKHKLFLKNCTYVDAP